MFGITILNILTLFKEHLDAIQKNKLGLIRLSFMALIFLHGFQQIEGYSIRLDIFATLSFCILSMFLYGHELFQILKNSTCKYFGWFFIWTLLVNSAWSLLYKDIVFLKNSVFYLGIYIFIGALSIFLKKDSIWIFRNVGSAIIGSLFLVFISSFIAEETYWRNSIFFSQINKLSRFALFSTVILFLLHYKTYIKSSLLLVGIGLSIYLIAITYSKAAIIALVALLVLGLLYTWKNVLSGVSIGVALLFIIPNYVSSGKISSEQLSIEKIESRIHESGRYDNLWSRGYDRIYNFPEYVILGASEQYRKRFDNNNYEVHSTVVNVLFSYGIVGLSIMGFFLFRFISFKPNFVLLFFIPILLHSLVHNDIRSIFLWLFVVIFSFIHIDENSSMHFKLNQNV